MHKSIFLIISRVGQRRLARWLRKTTEDRDLPYQSENMAAEIRQES